MATMDIEFEFNQDRVDKGKEKTTFNQAYRIFIYFYFKNQKNFLDLIFLFVFGTPCTLQSAIQW